MNKSFDRFVIASTGSGRGKTTISTALLVLLKRKGFDIHGFKCGPDFIDPMYHSKVLGLPSKNLDPYFCQEELLKASFCDGAGDINLIEGCMGLYDGMGVTSEYSTYSVAETLSSPVILVVDGYGMGASILAEIKGFLDFDEASLIKGVILNRVSEGYYNKISPEIEEKLGIKTFGFVPRLKDVNFESRYLGLLSPEENDALNVAEKIADLLEKTIDLEGIINIVRSCSSPIACKELKEFVDADLNGSVVAVARDEAFSFYYSDNLKALKLAGAGLIYFSPMKDEKVPDEATAIYLGGGYPELYLSRLSANQSMLSSIKEKIEGDMPVVAECGGFMYLNSAIEGSQMAGIFKDEVIKTKGLVRFGYVSGDYRDYHLLGHEFHHYDVKNPGEEFAMKKASTGEEYSACHVYKRCVAGFPHFYFLSDSHFLKEFS